MGTRREGVFRVKNHLGFFRAVVSFLLVLTVVSSPFSAYSFGSQHLEITYGENDNDDIVGWDDIDDASITTWDNANVIYWSDVDEFSDWVYSEFLFDDITDEMPVVECRVLDYRSNGKYFDGELIYSMVGDQFDINSFLAKYAIGTGVIVICVILNVVTAGASTPVACFIAGAADASISLAIKGAAFGAAAKAISAAIKSGGDFEETLYGALEGSADGYMWGAIFGAVTGGFGSKYCFIENTKVKTDNGYMRISELKVGSKVLSYSEADGKYTYASVTQINTASSSSTVRITVDDEIIECTTGHPFLTYNGWVPASELCVGDLLLVSEHRFEEVSNIETVAYDEPVTTYNLCVEDSHTFTVGYNDIVVHNKCKPNEKYANSTYKFPEGSTQALKYPNGVPYNANGYPVFDQYAIKTVKFDFPTVEGRAAGRCLTGNCTSDFKLANQAVGLTSQPPGTTWHHCEDMMTMQLVPQDVHSVVFGGAAHAGGESLLKEFWALILGV